MGVFLVALYYNIIVSSVGTIVLLLLLLYMTYCVHRTLHTDARFSLHRRGGGGDWSRSNAKDLFIIITVVIIITARSLIFLGTWKSSIISFLRLTVVDAAAAYTYTHIYII